MMNPLYRHSFAIVEPVQTLSSGDTIDIDFPDSDGLGPDLKPLPPELFDIGPATPGNPVYGPIAVNNAQPADAIRIDFLKITPSRKTARTLLAPNHGLLPDASLEISGSKPQHMYLWKVESGRACLSNPLGSRPVEIAANPFLGCVATAVGTPTSSLLPYYHGGNIDHPDLVEGTSLWLPASVPGGLLYLGDMHAAQGHGETAGGGLEISGTARIQVCLLPQLRLTMPRYRTPKGFASLAVEKTFDLAARRAQTELIHWLETLGWNLFDAQMLVSQTCEFRAGGWTADYAVVSCFVPYAKAGLSEGVIAC